MPFVLISLGLFLFFFFFALYNTHFNLVIELSVFLLTYYNSFHFYLSAFYISPLLFQCFFFLLWCLISQHPYFWILLICRTDALWNVFECFVSVFYVNKYSISFNLLFLNPPEHRVVYKPFAIEFIVSRLSILLLFSWFHPRFWYSEIFHLVWTYLYSWKDFSWFWLVMVVGEVELLLVNLKYAVVIHCHSHICSRTFPSWIHFPFV